MAYTSVIPVRRLDCTVDYVQNKEKTTPKSLEEAVDYAANRDKTESACFETGLGCTTTSAFEDMRLNTLRWHKETGVQGYHLVQSFAEGKPAVTAPRSNSANRNTSVTAAPTLI